MAKILVNMASSISTGSSPSSNRLINPFYEGFINRLAVMGNRVYTLVGNEVTHYPELHSLRRSLNRDLFIESIQSLQVDLFISFDHSFPSELVEALQCPMVIWFVGPLEAQGDLELLKKNASRFISFFRTPELQKYFLDLLSLPKDRSFIVQDATDIAPISRPRTREIVFVGSPTEMPAELRVFMRDCLQNPQLSAFAKGLWKTFRAHPHLSVAEICEKIGFAPLYQANQASLQGIGSHLRNTLNSELRIETLRECSELGLEIYGRSQWLEILRYSADTAICYHSDKMNFVHAVTELYNSSKIGLNINPGWMRGGFSWRARDIMASNAVLLTQENDKKDFERQFGGTLKLPIFSTAYEAREIAAKLLTDHSWRADLVAATHAVIEQGHRFSHRVIQIQQILNLPLINPKIQGHIEEITTDIHAAA